MFLTKWQWLIKKLTKKIWVRITLFCVGGVLTALFAYLIRDFIPYHISQKIGAHSVDLILEIIATTMLTVTTFSLSIMVSAYSAATSSATPRATQLLLADNTAQNALSVFIGSFLYSLVGIIGLAIGAYDNEGRLVLFIVTIIVIILIITVLIKWINHLALLGRVGETISMVENETAAAIKYRINSPCLGGTPLANFKKDNDYLPITSCQIGYVQHIDMVHLSEIAEKQQITIYIDALPGKFSDSSQPIAYTDKKIEKETIQKIRNSFVIDNNRSFEQDPRFGLIVLTEIASRALSPATNDPGTAIEVISTLVRVLTPWITSPHKKSEIHFPRIHVPPLKTGDLFDDVFTPIGRDGANMIEVCINLQKSLNLFESIGDKEAVKEAKRHTKLLLKRAKSKLINDDFDTLRSV